MVVGRCIRLAGTIAASNLALITAWGTSNQQTETEAIFYQHGQNEWISSSSNIAMKVEGCVIAATDDNEDVGCMEDESGDGTTYWYQMAACRRAQVAYSVYATDSGSASCSSAHFKGTVSFLLVVWCGVFRAVFRWIWLGITLWEIIYIIKSIVIYSCFPSIAYYLSTPTLNCVCYITLVSM